MNAAYHLETWLWLPVRREEVFAFFADAGNLERITPAFLRFHLLAAPPAGMRAGSLIEYRLRLHGVPIGWTTEITRWEPPDTFTDTQLRGPYARWIHTHTFEAQDGGTRVRDSVEYAIPGPRLTGRVVNALLVAPDTRRIFEFRHEALLEVFGTHGAGRKGPVVIRTANRAG